MLRIAGPRPDPLPTKVCRIERCMRTLHDAQRFAFAGVTIFSTISRKTGRTNDALCVPLFFRSCRMQALCMCRGGGF